MTRRRPPRPDEPGEALDLFLDPLFALANAAAEQVAEMTAPAVREPARRVAAAPGESAASAIPVSILTQTAKEVVEGAFPMVWVRGEITGFKQHRNGHWYFCLTDGLSQVRCVLWSRDQRRVPAPPDDGMMVAARGQLTVYPARGEMQLVVTAIEAEGDGLQRKALERTLARLERDGLLDPSRKRPLPRFPRCVAVVTSPDGAAIRDIIAVARRRAPNVRIVVVPAAVQGDSAPAQLCAALESLRRWAGADVAIVGRGGGGKEDLRAFNDERVARALGALPMPVVSAVGHEIDTTVCDLVADVRAPTPSAAAEAAVPVLDDLRDEVDAYRRALVGAVRRRVADARTRVDATARAAGLAALRVVERKRAAAAALGGRLDALSPLATLARGYAVARTTDGGTLASAASFEVGQRFDLLLRDGRVGARAEDVDVDKR
jgi:exodeoxyribonuclease VII large subunit